MILISYLIKKLKNTYVTIHWLNKDVIKETKVTDIYTLERL